PFEIAHLGHPHLELIALDAGEEIARLDLGNGAQAFADVVMVGGVVGDDADERGDAEPYGLGVDDGAVAGDDAVLLQFGDAVLHRGRGETDPPRQFGVGGTPVGAQKVHDGLVDLVHSSRITRVATCALCLPHTRVLLERRIQPRASLPYAWYFQAIPTSRKYVQELMAGLTE
ncbi:hypothetical protein ADL26_17935, partial [Thermoactinomyces vulgaris]